MKLFHTIEDTVAGAVKNVTEKSRRTAVINRLRLVIKTEEDNADEAYIALGKYYYAQLRDELNNETEPFCEIIDQANHRIDKAVACIEKLKPAVAPVDKPKASVTVPVAESPISAASEDAVQELQPSLPSEPEESAPTEIPVEQEWNEWVHTLHVETAPVADKAVSCEPETSSDEISQPAQKDEIQNDVAETSEKNDEVAQNFDQGIPW